jgi:CRISPR-associated protein Cas5t
MKVLRIKIDGWTASFRYPGFISGFQPTLPVPPISTIYGLISAARGELTVPEDVSIGYVFDFESKTVDLETIYELSPGLSAKSNVVRREFLYNPELYL